MVLVYVLITTVLYSEPLLSSTISSNTCLLCGRASTAPESKIFTHHRCATVPADRDHSSIHSTVPSNKQHEVPATSLRVVGMKSTTSYKSPGLSSRIDHTQMFGASLLTWKHVLLLERENLKGYKTLSGAGEAGREIIPGLTIISIPTYRNHIH